MPESAESQHLILFPFKIGDSKKLIFSGQ